MELSKQKEEQAKEQVKLLSVKLDEEREKQVELQEKISQNRLEVSSFQQKNNYVAENIHRIEESLHNLEPAPPPPPPPPPPPDQRIWRGK